MPFPSFLLPPFAIAGVAAAAAAVVIHLLNRRRFRVVQWAAMDFLREAVIRSRRILQLRDLLLLALRVLCLLAFGAALARPYLTRSAATLVSSDQPVHAVLLVDNSLSMSYQRFGGAGTLLDDAKAKAKEQIERLPRGSRISVLPTCGSPTGTNHEAYFSVQEALAALEAIEPVDRATRPDPVIDLALEVCRRLPGMPAKQIFLFTDPKVAEWPGEALAEHLKQLPSPMEIIQVVPDSVENAWIADFRLRDGVADTQGAAVFVAKVGYQGESPRKGVVVTLTIDGATVAQQTVDLEPGQVREVEFPPHHFDPRQFDAAAEDARNGTRKTTYAAAEVSIPQDRLPADDQRFLVVPVVSAVPVVFVDQYGSDEDRGRGRYGDTYWLRRFLAPVASGAARDQQLVKVRPVEDRSVKIDQLTQKVLADARLVVVAGVPSPQGAVPLLREYVEQGGNLIIAAGGDFDPVAWNEAAWRGSSAEGVADGLGILPVPLRPAAVGHLRDEPGGDTPPFALDFDTLVHEYFWPEGTPEDELRGLLGPPTLFFKAVAAEADDQVSEQVAVAVKEHLGRQRRALGEIDGKIAEIDGRLGPLRSTADAASAGKRGELEQQRAELQRQRDVLHPNWLAWKGQQDAEEGQPPLDELAERARPKVMGRFTNGLPFMVRRNWGRGQVLLITTGLSPQWTTMPNVRQSWWLLDRIARSLLVDTVPQRTASTERPMVLPISAAERSARFTLTDSDGHEQTLAVDPLPGGNRYAVTLGNITRRGVYRLAATRTKDSPQEGGLEARLWEVPVALNGPADESELGLTASETLKAGRHSFLDATQASGVTMVRIQGMDLWQWGLVLVLGCLLTEIGLLAWFGSGERST
jgi:hypothetical protein